VEQAVQAVVDKNLRDIEPELAARGIRVESKPIVRRGAGKTYESELCIYFWRGNELCDALEFHIAREGKIVANETDVEAWLPKQLAPMLDGS
jgi:hypothetical protein